MAGKMADESSFDESYYLALYPDVAAAVDRGECPSGDAHWRAFGKGEGRRAIPPVETIGLGGGIFPPETFRYPYGAYGRLAEFGFAEPVIGADDERVAQRLIAAWKLARSEEPDNDLVDRSGMWALLPTWNPTLFAALESEDTKALVSLMSSMFLQRITHGIAMGYATAEMARRMPIQFCANVTDRLLRLAEALGVLSVRSPEQGDYSALLSLDLDAVVSAVESKLGVPLAFPKVGAPYGMRVNAGIFPEISFTHIYAAHRISRYLRDAGQLRTFEIGGGFGGLAYFMQKIQPRNYTIYDLPFSCLIQGFFLLKAELPVAVRLYGEEPASGPAITVLPWWEIKRSEKYDVAINQDSLPEMPPHIGAYYIREICKITKKLFFSINQEQTAINTGSMRQTVVSKIMAAETGLLPTARNLFWMRDGYVEEIYEL